MFKNLKLQAPVATILAVASGIIMLLTYVLPMDSLRAFILDLVVIGAAVSLLIGVTNLLGVHLKKMRDGESPIQSGVLLVASTHS